MKKIMDKFVSKNTYKGSAFMRESLRLENERSLRYEAGVTARLMSDTGVFVR